MGSAVPIDDAELGGRSLWRQVGEWARPAVVPIPGVSRTSELCLSRLGTTGRSENGSWERARNACPSRVATYAGIITHRAKRGKTWHADERREIRKDPLDES